MNNTMPGYDDPGYGCDNDLNNYSHDGSSVLNDSGSNDSGSRGGVHFPMIIFILCLFIHIFCSPVCP
ncbi:MAG: hypothetical protein JSS82_08925 [Bacteroidetes bacterium]|nr:hypothetical protein [Bacteroidota bacterium]